MAETKLPNDQLSDMAHRPQRRFATSSSGVAALLLFAAMSTHAEGLTICTLAGCIGGIGISVEGLPPQLATGVYTLKARLNGQAMQCEVTVNAEQSSPATCKTSTDAPWVELWLDGSDRYISIHGSAPRHIDVSLLLDGRVLAQRVIEPGSYAVSAPNGKVCGPICLFAGPYTLDVAADSDKLPDEGLR